MKTTPQNSNLSVAILIKGRLQPVLALGAVIACPTGLTHQCMGIAPMTTALKEENKVEYRGANDSDVLGIFAILQEVAPEIPLSIDTPESQEVMKSIIAECCASGESWVAVGADGAIVGLALVKPDRLERFFHRNEALSLRYVGVSVSRRRQGIFRILMENLMAKKVPLTAEVLHGNLSGMVDRLSKIGFTKSETDTKVVKLRWEHTTSAGIEQVAE